MILCNFSNTDYSINWYNNDWNNLNNFLKSNNLSGIELLLHGNYEIDNIPKDIVKGLHLSYFPTWLEFYNNNIKYKEDFRTEKDVVRAFGGTTKEVILERYRKEFEIAKSLECSYMVFHVSHVTIKDAFKFSYDYSNKEVLDGVIDIVNNVFKEDSEVKLLFENLWWPGLTLLSKLELDYLMDSIKYKNKGVMLDLSHLLITNKNISDLEMGTKYILECLKNLGDSVKWIKGLHINSTLCKDYLNSDHSMKYEEYTDEEDEYKKFSIVYEHISKIDSHKPYNCKSLKKIIDYVNPEIKVIEVNSNEKEVWEKYIQEQLKYIEV